MKQRYRIPSEEVGTKMRGGSTGEVSGEAEHGLYVNEDTFY